MLKNKIVILSLISILIVLYSCGSKVTFDSTVAVPQNGWHKDTVAFFKSEIKNLEQISHLLLEVQNTETYAYSNIWFFVDAISPSGKVSRDTLECRLASNKGDWYGKSGWGSDVYSSTHPYKLNIRFPEKGIYKYYVVQGMRDTILAGITEVGIKIVKAK